jgi:DNA-binding HxlR family transcriptional regulator/putative sterol carrier protein
VATPRTYGDRCGLARALDVVGDRWALLVIRELVLGPKRFKDLQRGLPRASPDVLTARARELETAGVVQRRTLPPPAGSRIYELTEWGRQLEPIVLQLGRWGATAPLPEGKSAIGADSVVLGLRTVFAPEAAAGLDATIELRLAGEVYHAQISHGQLSVARGETDQPDSLLDTDPETLEALLWHDYPLARAVRSGKLTIEGDSELAARFLTLFPVQAPLAA